MMMKALNLQFLGITVTEVTRIMGDRVIGGSLVSKLGCLNTGTELAGPVIFFIEKFSSFVSSSRQNCNELAPKCSVPFSIYYKADSESIYNYVNCIRMIFSFFWMELLNTW